MTNVEIITAYKNENGIEMEVELNTYHVWKKMGYVVKKNEKSNHKVDLWQRGQKKVEEINKRTGEIEEKTKQFFYLKTCHLFEESQVEKIGAKN